MALWIRFELCGGFKFQDSLFCDRNGKLFVLYQRKEFGKGICLLVNIFWVGGNYGKIHKGKVFDKRFGIWIFI